MGCAERARLASDKELALIFSRYFLVILLATSAVASVRSAEIIFVKLLVDEEEATNQNAWRLRLSERLNEASSIIARYADVRFAVIGFGTWQSDNRIQDLSKSLREFEQEVDPGQARIAIGFSSQYQFQSGRNHLGGTRGPLRSHILVRENAPSIRERERLEVLVHEMGHFLCAAHSHSPESVMRPIVGDGQARAASFRIAFDPWNSKIMRLAARELRDRKVTQFQQMSTNTLVQLRGPYQELARRLPKDPTALRYLAVIDAILKQSQPPPEPRALLSQPPAQSPN